MPCLALSSSFLAKLPHILLLISATQGIAEGDDEIASAYSLPQFLDSENLFGDIPACTSPFRTYLN